MQTRSSSSNNNNNSNRNKDGRKKRGFDIIEPTLDEVGTTAAAHASHMSSVGAIDPPAAHISLSELWTSTAARAFTRAHREAMKRQIEHANDAVIVEAGGAGDCLLYSILDQLRCRAVAAPIDVAASRLGVDVMRAQMASFVSRFAEYAFSLHMPSANLADESDAWEAFYERTVTRGMSLEYVHIFILATMLHCPIRVWNVNTISNDATHFLVMPRTNAAVDGDHSMDAFYFANWRAVSGEALLERTLHIVYLGSSPYGFEHFQSLRPRSPSLAPSSQPPHPASEQQRVASADAAVAATSTSSTVPGDPDRDAANASTASTAQMATKSASKKRAATRSKRRPARRASKKKRAAQARSPPNTRKRSGGDSRRARDAAGGPQKRVRPSPVAQRSSAAQSAPQQAAVRADWLNNRLRAARHTAGRSGRSSPRAAAQRSRQRRHRFSSPPRVRRARRQPTSGAQPPLSRRGAVLRRSSRLRRPPPPFSMRSTTRMQVAHSREQASRRSTRSRAHVVALRRSARIAAARTIDRGGIELR